MRIGDSTITAMEFMALDKEHSNYQKELGAASVIPKPGVTTFLAKLTNYLEDDRFPNLNRHELEKEAYLRTMRKSQCPYCNRHDCDC